MFGSIAVGLRELLLREKCCDVPVGPKHVGLKRDSAGLSCVSHVRQGGAGGISGPICANEAELFSLCPAQGHPLQTCHPGGESNHPTSPPEPRFHFSEGTASATPHRGLPAPPQQRLSPLGRGDSWQLTARPPVMLSVVQAGDKNMIFRFHLILTTTVSQRLTTGKGAGGLHTPGSPQGHM